MILHRTTALALSFFAALTLVGCSKATQSHDTIHIAISGDTSGWITPCGCTANQSGGLERRASLLKSLGTSRQMVYLDAGGSLTGSSEYQQLKLRSILVGDRDMGLESHNIGAAETAIAPATLKKIADEAGVQFLSANLEPSSLSSDTKLFVNHRIVDRSGIKILVTGVIDPRLVKNREWTTRDAATSLLSIIKQHPADIIVVLAYMDEPGLRSLAESVPEVDFIVGGPTGQVLPPTMVGAVQVMSATNKGKFLACIELKKQGKGWKTIQIGPKEVSSTLPRDSVQTKNIDAFLEALEEKDFAAEETGLVSNLHTNAGDRYEVAGSESCLACHKTDDQVWHSSKHSHAWKTLVDKRSHVDPSCQQCHTTGYGMQGGFSQVGMSQGLVNVGCESCHGPSKAHVLLPSIKTPYLAREQCVRCHDHENSPEFVFATYWGKIAHGKATPSGNGESSKPE
jgi:2',3'-cyclic-nucleotide 2'-phosphodiesterase (5'-nucleotidase family)